MVTFVVGIVGVSYFNTSFNLVGCLLLYFIFIMHALVCSLQYIYALLNFLSWTLKLRITVKQSKRRSFLACSSFFFKLRNVSPISC